MPLQKGKIKFKYSWVVSGFNPPTLIVRFVDESITDHLQKCGIWILGSTWASSVYPNNRNWLSKY